MHDHSQKAFYVYYPSPYIQVEEMNRARFQTEIVLPTLSIGEKVEKIRLHARTVYSPILNKWIGEGYAEVITSVQ